MQSYVRISFLSLSWINLLLYINIVLFYPSFFIVYAMFLLENEVFIILISKYTMKLRGWSVFKVYVVVCHMNKLCRVRWLFKFLGLLPKKNQNYTFVSMIHLLFLFCDTRGAALLVEAAEMGNPEALYELGCRLRVEVSLLCGIFCYYFQKVTNTSSFNPCLPSSQLLYMIRVSWIVNSFIEHLWRDLDSCYVMKALLLSKNEPCLFSYPKGL